MALNCFSLGEEDIVMLPRAGWVGTWRHGAVLWSGDIGSTMEVLKSRESARSPPAACDSCWLLSA
jgi:alpha-glucosidase (family GH31 glycosyl hydrolase)